MMAKHAFICAAGIIGLPDRYLKALIVLEKISHYSIATNLVIIITSIREFGHFVSVNLTIKISFVLQFYDDPFMKENSRIYQPK